MPMSANGRALAFAPAPLPLSLAPLAPKTADGAGATAKAHWRIWAFRSWLKSPDFCPQAPPNLQALASPFALPPFWLLPTLCLLCPLWACPPAFLYGAFPLAHLPLFGSGFHACPPCPLLPSLPLWRSANKPCFLDLALGDALGLSVFCTRLSTALGVSGWLWLWDSPVLRSLALCRSEGSLGGSGSGTLRFTLSGSLPFGVWAVLALGLSVFSGSFASRLWWLEQSRRFLHVG